MINRAEMLKPNDMLARLPIYTDQQAIDNLRSRIEIVRKNIEKPSRIGLPPSRMKVLFSFTAEEYAYLEGMNWRDGKIGRVETDRLQTLGLGVMKEYGFDEKISQSGCHEIHWPKDGITDNQDGTSEEMRLYPSQTINGLTFERVKKFSTDEGKVLSVSWSVLDNAPLFSTNLGKKIKA